MEGENENGQQGKIVLGALILVSAVVLMSAKNKIDPTAPAEPKKDAPAKSRMAAAVVFILLAIFIGWMVAKKQNK